jgi:hypothetical protein
MILKCPFCPCEFCSQVDLDRHLDSFGRVDHLLAFERLHESAEIYEDWLRNGADRVVFEIVWLIVRCRVFS